MCCQMIGQANVRFLVLFKKKDEQEIDFKKGGRVEGQHKQTKIYTHLLKRKV